MRILIFGDSHGRSIKPLYDIIKQENIQRIWNTGDIDTVEGYTEIIDFKKYCKRNQIVFESVHGNHEHAHLNKMKFSNGAIMRFLADENNLEKYPLLDSYNPKDNFQWATRITNQLYKNPEVIEFIRTMVKEGFVKEFSVGIQGAVLNYALIHGAFKGSKDRNEKIARKTERQGLIIQNWNRIEENNDINRNYNVMRERNLNVIIRGHDHTPEIITINPRINIETISEQNLNKKYEIIPRNKYIITHGAFYDGFYCILDTQEITKKDKFKRYILRQTGFKDNAFIKFRNLDYNLK